MNTFYDAFSSGTLALEQIDPSSETAQEELLSGLDELTALTDSLADISVPMELLPEKVWKEFNTDHSTMMAVFFDSATSEDVTMDAIREIRSIAGKQCFVSGMSALVTDLKDLCERANRGPW